jgi:hypothetical protein
MIMIMEEENIVEDVKEAPLTFDAVTLYIHLHIDGVSK